MVIVTLKPKKEVYKMTEEEIAVTLATHTQQISSLNNRSTSLWERCETFMESMTDLTTAVRELTMSMNSMQNAQVRIFKRLEELEAQPAEKWRMATKTAATAIISAIAGALAVGLVSLVASNM